MSTLITRRRLIVAILAVGLILALLLGGRSAARLYHRLTGPPPPPRQVDVSAIAGWMTVRYVARAYRVPPPELYDALGISAEGHRASSLDDIASETGRTSEEVLAIVRERVTAWQRANPPPKPGGPKPERPPG